MSSTTDGRGDVPLCVDMDGTLVRTDMLHETALLLAKRSPASIALLPLWLGKGRAHVKRQIAERVTIEAASLPYTEELLDFLRAEKARGRTLVLVTAADARVAQAVASHLGLFSQVIASDGVNNVAGAHKAEILNARFGAGGYDYAGNSRRDLPVWRSARQAIGVNLSASARAHCERSIAFSRVIDGPSGGLRSVVRASRFQQWVKNLLVFTPLFMSHRLADAGDLVSAILAFVSFGLCASSVYVLNDLLDVTADRVHPVKRRRPFAAGDLPVAAGVVMIPAYLLGSVLVARQLPLPFLGVLATYYALTVAYSFLLKRMALVDVITLAVLYTLRLFAGGAAVGIPLSFWFVAFSIFMFFSLAAIKRYVALHASVGGGTDVLKGRGYYPEDLPKVAIFGIVSGFMAVLVLGLYLNSDDVLLLYRRPGILGISGLVILYWICRMWLLVGRNQMNEDPISFALKDRHSYLALLLVVLALLLAL